ncbi:MAG: calcineurin-like phosphoesterase C-terminal domain-containing protein [Tepidisphaerales bacterium]
MSASTSPHHHWTASAAARLGLLMAATLAWSSSALAQTVASGVVFEDANRNGVRDAGERGLAGVRVSDGRQIVTTDADGRYRMEIGDDVTLFVLKPRDFATPIDQLNLPRFYRHHVPAGTPDERFVHKGIPPTGDLPASVDFALVPSPEPESFRVALFGDPQAYTTEEMTWYTRDVVSEFARLAGTVAFGIALGDLVGDNLDLFEAYNQANALAGFPWYNVLGNHDINFDALTDKHADATFRRVFGPSSYAFQYGPAHFFILNNVFWEGFRGLRRDGHAQRGHYRGMLRPEQLEFVRAYLETIPLDAPVIIATHIPLISGAENPSPGGTTAEFPQLLELLANRPNTFSVNAHTHYNLTTVVDASRGFRGEGMVHMHHNVATISGSWYTGEPDERGIPLSMMRDGTPRGYAIAEIDGKRVQIHYQPLHRPDTEQIRIHAPDLALRDAGTVTVQANVFDASERSIVRMRLLGGDGRAVVRDWTSMSRRRALDPLYVRLHEQSTRWAAQVPGRRPLSAPEAIEHHYFAELDTALPTGLYAVEVETVSSYGRTFTARHPLRIVASEADFRGLDANSVRTPRPGSPAAREAATRPAP